MASISAPSPAPPEVMSVPSMSKSSKRRLLAGIGLDRFWLRDFSGLAEFPLALADGERRKGHSDRFANELGLHIHVPHGGEVIFHPMNDLHS